MWADLTWFIDTNAPTVTRIAVAAAHAGIIAVRAGAHIIKTAGAIKISRTTIRSRQGFPTDTV